MSHPTVQRALFNEDAEQAVLAAMLIDGGAVITARDVLCASDFWGDGHRLLYRAMLAVSARGATLDPITLADALAGDLERAGGKDYIGFLVDAVPTALNVEYHAALVVEAAKRRALADRLAEFTEDLRSGASMAADAVVRLQPMLDVLALGARTDALRSFDDEQVLHLPLVSFLVSEILPRGGACEMHGPPGVGKSFIALDLAMSVATGRPFLGHAVERASVIYVAAEGSSGLPNRVGAWKRRHGYHGRQGVRFIPEPVGLLDAANVSRFLAAMRTAADQPGLIVFDTLARCMVGGEENSAKDMGLVIDNVARIQKATGASVLLIHHTRKDGESERGSTALRGAMDAMFAVRGEEGGLTLHCDKQKDAPEIDPIRLRLSPEGESCVLVTAIHALQSDPDRTTSGERSALESLQRDFLDDGATAAQWQVASGLPQRTFYTVRTRLVTRGYVNNPHGKRGGKYTLTDAGTVVVTANCRLTAA